MRIRTIKPEFWTHPVLSRLSHEARLAAIGLLNIADDDGFFLADAALIRSALWPFDEDSTNARRSLESLSKAGYIELRDSETHGPIGLVLNFSKHQRIDRPTASKLARYYNSSNPRRALDESSLLEGKGKEQGNEGNREGEDVPSSRRRFTPPTRAELDLEAGKIGLPQQQVDLFVNYYASKGWKVGKSPMVSWKHALAGWKTRWEENRNGHINLRPSTGRAAVVAERNATLGPNAAEHASEARARSRAIDEANAARFEATGLTPFDDDPTPVSGESAGAR